jgi:hypothetical protein
MGEVRRQGSEEVETQVEGFVKKADSILIVDIVLFHFLIEKRRKTTRV